MSDRELLALADEVTAFINRLYHQGRLSAAKMCLYTIGWRARILNAQRQGAA